MRFYDIIIKDKNGKVIRSPSLSGFATANFRNPSLFGFGLPTSPGQASAGTTQKSSYTSYVNRQTLPGALQIVLNIPVYTMATPDSGTIDIWGVSKEEISQSFNLMEKEIEVYAGMREGLPLAKPNLSQQPIARGVILQAFGSWQGTEQVLHLVIRPDGIGRAGDNQNFSFSYKANSSLKDAIIATMQKAMPRTKVSVFISDELKFDTDLNGVYGSLSTFNIMLIQLTQRPVFQGIKTVTGMKYGGIEAFMLSNGKEVVFTDRTVNLKGGREIKAGSSGTIEISFSDIIGQPTWQGPNQINFKTVMRSDIGLADRIKIPQAVAPIAIQTPGSSPPAQTDSQGHPFASRNKSTFNGEFIVTSVRHMGNFRQPSGDAWVTNFVAVFPAQGTQEEKIPEGTVTVGQPQKLPDKVAPQESTVVNPTPPNVVTTQILSGFPANPNSLNNALVPPPGIIVPPPMSVRGALPATAVPSLQGLVVRSR